MKFISKYTVDIKVGSIVQLTRYDRNIKEIFDDLGDNELYGKVTEINNYAEYGGVLLNVIGETEVQAVYYDTKRVLKSEEVKFIRTTFPYLFI